MGGPRKKASRNKAAFFSVAQWVPLNEAFARAKAALGSSDLAERDLVEHMRSGQLPSAMRQVERDDTEMFARIKPPFWDGLTLMEAGSDGLGKGSGTVQVRGLKVTANAKLWFFVARGHLDKLYPVSRVRADGDDEPTTSRKPGPRPTRNWKLHVAGELDRLIKAGKPIPTASELAQYCVDTLGHHPDISDIQKLIRAVI